MINFNLTAEQFTNLLALITAGAKSPHTDHMAVIAAGKLLTVLNDQAVAQQETKLNGAHEAAVQSQ